MFLVTLFQVVMYRTSVWEKEMTNAIQKVTSPGLETEECLEWNNKSILVPAVVPPIHNVKNIKVNYTLAVSANEKL